MAYCTQTDLEIALGSAAELVQLGDPTGSGIVDPARVDDYLESGAGVIRGIIAVKYDPETIDNLDADSRRFLRDLNKWFSARIAWLEGGRGQAIPDRIQQQADWCDGELTKIRTGERMLGRVTGGVVAAMAQPVGIVDHDPLGIKFSIAGFRRGFR